VTASRALCDAAASASGETHGQPLREAQRLRVPPLAELQGDIDTLTADCLADCVEVLDGEAVGWIEDERGGAVFVPYGQDLPVGSDRRPASRNYAPPGLACTRGNAPKDRPEA
jgi:hypothetical protein